MKIRLRHIVLFFFSLCGIVPTMAQDAGMSDVEITAERDRAETEKIIFSPGEAEVRYIPKSVGTLAKDSVFQTVDLPSSKQRVEPAAKPVEKQPSKQDDSILSFNFLYYIIQKYKLQDIID